MKRFEFVKIATLCVIFFIVTPSSCWQFFTSLTDLKLSNSEPEFKITHSEYQFGECNRKKNSMFYTHVHLDRMAILGKVIVRGWIDIIRIPTCIILRGRSNEEDAVRSTSYNFQMCVPRITYCHSKTRFKYFYYEWYLPTDVGGGIDWDIYFFGPENLKWQ